MRLAPEPLPKCFGRVNTWRALLALAIAALLGAPVLTGVSGRDPHSHADVSHVAPAQFFRASSLTRSHPRQQFGARSLA